MSHDCDERAHAYDERMHVWCKLVMSICMFDASLWWAWTCLMQACDGYEHAWCKLVMGMHMLDASLWWACICLMQACDGHVYAWCKLVIWACICLMQLMIGINMFDASLWWEWTCLMQACDRHAHACKPVMGMHITVTCLWRAYHACYMLAMGINMLVAASDEHCLCWTFTCMSHDCNEHAHACDEHAPACCILITGMHMLHVCDGHKHACCCKLEMSMHMLLISMHMLLVACLWGSCPIIVHTCFILQRSRHWMCMIVVCLCTMALHLNETIWLWQFIRYTSD